MTPPDASSAGSVLFLSPEAPVAGAGGGGLRSASVLEYLRRRYAVQVASFTLPEHSRSVVARAWRNGWRLIRGRPPLLDRYSGLEAQLAPMLGGRHYRAAVIEHFWCAPYARCLRPHCELLVLDLHNVESELARSHAQATRGLPSAAFSRFSASYRRLEREWLPQFDVVLVASEEDRRRIEHRNVHVYPNALPEIARPSIPEATPESAGIVFSGNLEYHPNVEAVRWFHTQVWPRVRERLPGIEWRLVGRNAEAVAGLVSGSERVRIVGPVEDAIRALAEASVCIAPLRSGSGTRFKILEAWAAGRAVVSTTVGAEGLDARPGEHLLIADEPGSFAEAIVKLMEHPELRRRLGESGRALYLDRYTWSSAWRALEAAGL
jgi:glycosyltransferase involved in cell wall biosynthesis